MEVVYEIGPVVSEKKSFEIVDGRTDDGRTTEPAYTISSPGAFGSGELKKANQTLGFLKRTINVHNKDLKSLAYKTLVRPQLMYASTVWSPHTATNIHKLESVQQRAARWATRDYRYTSSATSMLQDLNWRTLDQRRIDSRLIMMYKVTHDLVAIPALDYLTHLDISIR